MKRNFFITGRPSSRTAWLANFLSCGDAICYHDATRFTGTDARCLKNFLSLNGKKTVGDSDSGLLAYFSEVVWEFPEARWVLVNREANSAKASFARRFPPERPYPNGPRTGAELGRVFEAVEQLFRQAARALPRANTLFVEFEKLGDEKTAQEIWEWCLPGVEFCRERWAVLNGLQVNVMV